MLVVVIAVVVAGIAVVVVVVGAVIVVFSAWVLPNIVVLSYVLISLSLRRATCNFVGDVEHAVACCRCRCVVAGVVFVVVAVIVVFCGR